MKTILLGWNGWARMQHGASGKIRVIDAAITFASALLVAVTWAMIHR
jgi:hypothetical protein